MSRRFCLLLLAGLAGLYSGCSAAGGHGTSPLGEVGFKERTGQVTESDLHMRLPRVLARYGFFITTGERTNRNLVFETDWRMRQVFPEEQARGITAARNRLRFRAVWNGKLYSLSLQMDNAIRDSMGQWHEEAPSKEFLAYARQLAGDIRSELALGIRQY